MHSISQQICRRCGTTYYGDEVQAMFAQRTDRQKYTNVNSVCNPCLLTARTNAKLVNRFITKAKSTFNHHAKGFMEPRKDRPAWIAASVELADRFLWDIPRMSHDMEHAWQGVCECGQRFQDMPNGLHDLTIDIINPVEPPYWGMNTRFICTTCNRKKSKTPPNLWGASQAGWARWNKRQEELAKLPRWGQTRLWTDDDAENTSNN